MRAGRGDLHRHVPLHRHVAKDRSEWSLRIGLVMIWEVTATLVVTGVPGLVQQLYCFGCCSGTPAPLVTTMDTVFALIVPNLCFACVCAPQNL